MKSATFEKLSRALQGRLLRPQDVEYDSARRVFNAMIDARPLAIAQCAATADAVACVRFAREHNLPVTVRGGGHAVAGYSVRDGALLIDLSQMKAIEVDPARRTVRAQAGLRLGEFDQATQAHGLATTMGTFSTTGIAGLTLGGGLGWLGGKHGLTCDNLLAAEVVTADSRVLTASEKENADLFWALRGGGGNFGVVTSFLYRLHRLDAFLAGPAFFDLSQAREVLRFYREFTEENPDELRVDTGFVPAPDGRYSAGIAVAYCEKPDKGQRLAEPVRKFATPRIEAIGPISYCDWQKAFDPLLPPGKMNYWKSEFLVALTEAAVETLLGFAESRPSDSCYLYVEQMHGAASRVPVSATAFAHRRKQYALLIIATWDGARENPRCVNWVRECWKAVRPFAAGGVYANYLDTDESGDRFRAAFGPNYERLVELKTKYDPTNFFRFNQNIRPATGSEAARAD